MSGFSAGPSALGYLYQVTYALWLLLQRESARLHIEKLDDLQLDEAGDPAELLQLKHHTQGKAITDASVEFWKSLRVWMEGIADGSIQVDNMVLSLVTTAVASVGSAPSKLRPDDGRDVAGALQILIETAEKSTNKTIQKSVDVFKEMDDSTRLKMLESIHVLDSSPSIADVRSKLALQLSANVQREHRRSFADRVEGWWFGKCVDVLRGEVDGVFGYEVYDKLADIRDQFSVMSLPVDFLGVEPSDKERAPLQLTACRPLSISSGVQVTPPSS